MEEIKMQCPECKSTHIRKNGINKQGKQNHIYVTCGRQFIDNYEKQKGYDEKTKRECLTAYVNGMGFRGIERRGSYDPETIPEVGELDELETFVGSKKTKSGCGQPLTTLKKEF